jgi:2-amino-4-hydroxy-6-hydroxymethyldihydropteridine diphosphokinase
MATTFLLLGSNLGQKTENLRSAENEICVKIGNLIKKSSIIESPPWGFEHKEDFLNQVLQIETQYSPFELLKAILSIEKKFGRVRSLKKNVYLPRIIDIDILFYNGSIIETEKLVIPHPKLHLRRFTLEPLQEIAPDLIHPILGKTIQKLLEICTDDSKIKKLE